MACYKLERMTLEDLTDDMVYTALYQGMSPKKTTYEKAGQETTKHPARPNG
jgi:hypothetical protein